MDFFRIKIHRINLSRRASWHLPEMGMAARVARQRATTTADDGMNKIRSFSQFPADQLEQQ
jgi:hypothetical protein